MIQNLQILKVTLLRKDYMKNNITILIILFVVACGDYDNVMNSEESEPYYVPLEVYMNHPTDANGYYLVDYPNDRDNWYTEVLFKSVPTQRCYWGSNVSFETEYQNQTFSTPIVQYSTYSGSDSIGHQMVYLYQPFIDDTLMVGCCISEENCDAVEFIVY